MKKVNDIIYAALPLTGSAINLLLDRICIWACLPLGMVSHRDTACLLTPMTAANFVAEPKYLIASSLVMLIVNHDLLLLVKHSLFLVQ